MPYEPTPDCLGSISDNIFSRCAVAYSTDIDQCGCVTLCDVSPTLSTEIESIYKDESGNWRVMDAWLQQDFLVRACQAKTNGMYDFLMATRRDWSKRLTTTRLATGVLDVQPFVPGLRKEIINNEYWTVVAGFLQGGTAPNGEAYDYVAVVQSQSGIPGSDRWFHERDRVFIRGKTLAGSATLSAWRVVYDGTFGGYIALLLVSENTASNFPAEKLLPPGDRDAEQTGVLVRGTPNVTDYEKWCDQIPGINTNALYPYWVETTRSVTCYDELTQKFIRLIKENNKYYKQFQHVESAELNRQLAEDFQRRHAWTAWFNKPLPNQTLALWNNLDRIDAWSDDASGNYLYLPWEGRCVGRRANAVGFYEQLQECGRVKDLQGQVLNIPELQRALYSILRVRKALGMQTKVLELHTDSWYAIQLAQGLFRYFASKSEGLLRLNYDISANAQDAKFGFNFRRFQLDYPSVEFRIVTHDFWDDYVDAMKTAGAALESAGRFLFIWDSGATYQGTIASSTAENFSGSIQDIAKVNQDAMCVMKVPKSSRKLSSLTYANVLDCGKTSLWLENLSSEVPEHQQMVGDYYDIYGDYTGGGMGWQGGNPFPS